MEMRDNQSPHDFNFLMTEVLENGARINTINDYGLSRLGNRYYDRVGLTDIEEGHSNQGATHRPDSLFFAILALMA